MFLNSTLRRSTLSVVALGLFATGCGSTAKTTAAPVTTVTAVAVTLAAPVETTAVPAETVVAETVAAPTSAVAAATGVDPIPLLAGGGQRAWYITARATNGAAGDLPVCAKDDELIFDAKGGFISVIGGTQCNPSETEVPKGTYKISADNQVINFTTPAFSYPGKIITLTDSEMTLEFDLGPGFVIRDTFAKR
jgi:Lipocalin-like domain